MTDPLDPLDRDELCRLVRRGAHPKYLHFWGPDSAGPNGPGPGCLSQWWSQRFTTENHEFATAEHYMMWRKAILFADAEAARQVLAARHPRQAKQWGGRVRGFDETVWRAYRSEIVVAGNLAKFRQDPALAGYLVGTGSRVLVEASPMDRIWGIGLAADDPRAGDPLRWRGENLLGFALMAVRRRLRDNH